jgi:putative ABC transport system permease protein
MRQALRLALRALKWDWRAGAFNILVLALIVAITAVTAVGFFSDRILRAMEEQAAELLAADLVIVSSAPIRPTLRENAIAAGLKTAVTVDFPSVVLVGEDTLLVHVKAVEPAYPLYGKLTIADEPDGVAIPAKGPPKSGEVWADARLLNRFGLEMGARIGLGERTFTLTHVLAYEPDRGGQLFRLAPRVLMSRDDLADTGLVSANSRVRYRLLVAGAAEHVASYCRWLQRQVLPTEKLQDIRDARPELRRILERAQKFLGLAALIAVMVAGAAMALTARHYTERQMDTSAIMRCLGAPQRLIVQIQVLRVFIMGFAASLVGGILGYLAQTVLANLVGGWFVETLPPPSWRPMLTGVVTGVLMLGGFTFAPLWRLRNVPPLRVLRRDLGAAPPSTWATLLFAFTAMGVLLYWQVGGERIGVRLLFGAATIIAVLWMLAKAALMLLNRLRLHVGLAWRHGAARLLRRKGSAALQIFTLAIGITALLVLGVERVDLLKLWQEGLADGTPNHFLINIQVDEKPDMVDLFNRHSIATSAFYPLVRGRLVAINKQPVKLSNYDSPRAKHLIGREFNLTWTNNLQVDNKVVAGRWWGNEGDERSAYSVETGVADTLGIKLGDTLSYNVGGTEFSAAVTSLREIDWDSFNPNFFVIASPEILRNAPATLVTSFYLPPARKRVITELAQRFPSVTVIDIDAIMQQLKKLMNRAALAVEFVFLFTLMAGGLVMYAAIQSSQCERHQESALYRAMGASRKQVALSLLAEFVTIGVVAGVIAAFTATTAGYLLAEYVFELTYRPNPWLWIWGIAGGAMGVGVAGLIGTRRLLNQPPWRVLTHF